MAGEQPASGGATSPTGSAEASVAAPVATEAPTTTAPPAPGTAAATLPVAQIDFDALYRELDAMRSEGYHSANPDLYALVTSKDALLEEIREDAADTATSWDFSQQTYTVRSVEVFTVVDENRVLLTVVDEVAGTRVRRDATGAVVESRSRGQYPVLQFLVLLNRSSGRWMIDYDAVGAPIEFPMPRFDDFVAAGTVDVAGQTVTFAQSRPAGTMLACFMVRFPGDPVPQFGCVALGGYVDSTLMMLFRSSDGAYEAIAAMQGFRTERAAAVIEPDLTLPLDQPIGTWFYGVTAAEAGTLRSLAWGGSLTDSNGPVPLDDLRARVPEGEAVIEVK